MAEHGVDYQLYCWFSTSNSKTPIKTPSFSDALHKGYFNAKYSDQIRFAIMWENKNGSPKGSSSENFRNVVIPYWVEYYLTDPRYMTIDNKPVIAVFLQTQLVEDFGSAKGVKAEFDYLRAVCRGLGYDGAVILCQVSSTEASLLRQAESFGADAVYAYNWGKSNTSEAYISYINKQAAVMSTVPTISIGFNNVAWKGTRSELITPRDYKTALTWVRDSYGPKYKNSWVGKSLMLSTWNEYGEGTYLMPSGGLHGFGYLDALREVFAPNNRYENITPTAAQLSRLGSLYVSGRKMLSAEYRFTPVGKTNYILVNNDRQLEFTAYMPELRDGVMMVPFDPKSGLLTFMGCGFSWDAAAKALTVLHNGDRMTFVVGSNTAMLNGNPVKLSHKVESVDGLPMLPIDDLTGKLGITGYTLVKKSG